MKSKLEKYNKFFIIKTTKGIERFPCDPLDLHGAKRSNQTYPFPPCPRPFRVKLQNHHRNRDGYS